MYTDFFDFSMLFTQKFVKISLHENQSIISKPVYLRRHSGTTMPSGV